ncbi:hypothetical protein KR018_008535 [Drosophila ironensis]|nr:hypothetical protein KR018_008535 [Drosophila ironensis]
MAQNAKTAAGAKDQKKIQQLPSDHIDEIEVSELQTPRSFYDLVREQAERFASTWAGQYVIERTDRALGMIEDTASWSLPQGKTSPPLERPLPWGPFLMLIILLRVTRIWLSVGALMIGNGPISPSDMVYFIQTRRRKLRAIRVHGLRVIRQRQQEVSYSSGKGLTHKIGQWFSKAMCRPGVQRANSGRLFTVRNMEQTTQTSPAVSKRPREDEACPDDNLTIDQMLEKYANEDSENDSDFVPNLEEEEDTSANSSSEESSSESHSSEEISNGEKEMMGRQWKPLPVENGVHNRAEEKENDKGKLNAMAATNGGGGGSDNKEQAEVDTEKAEKKSQPPNASHSTLNGNPTPLSARTKPEDQWKPTPGHASAAKTSPGRFSNTAAAASSDPEPDPEPPSVSISESDPESQSHEDDNDTCSTSGSSTVCEKDSESSVTPIPDPQVEQILQLAAKLTAQQMSNYPAVDTLTPATSSEDIFYSPIGSPNYFNTKVGTPTPLQVNLSTALAQSTPDLELNNPSADSPLPECEESQPQKHAHPQQKQNQNLNHQNHQRQNHSHHRHRGGRNRR